MESSDQNEWLNITMYLIASSSVVIKRALCWDTTSTLYFCRCFFNHSDANEVGSM